jgi:hypothetical protein
VKKVFLILIICSFTFCAKKKAVNPEGLYTMEQVAVFLKDLYLLETKVKELKLKNDSAKVVFAYYENKLFEKHHMNDSVYRKSFNYYMSDIQGLSQIYEVIADSLSMEERLATVAIDSARYKYEE